MSRTATKMSSTSVPGTLAVVSFMADGHRFAVEAAQVRAQLSAGQSGTALTAEQLLGLLPCEETQNKASRRILLMKHPEGDYAVAVSKPVELQRLEISAVYPLPSLIVARNTLTGLRGLAMGPEGLILLVDFSVAKAQMTLITMINTDFS